MLLARRSLRPLAPRGCGRPMGPATVWGGRGARTVPIRSSPCGTHRNEGSTARPPRSAGLRPGTGRGPRVEAGPAPRALRNPAAAGWLRRKWWLALGCARGLLERRLPAGFPGGRALARRRRPQAEACGYSGLGASSPHSVQKLWDAPPGDDRGTLTGVRLGCRQGTGTVIPGAVLAVTGGFVHWPVHGAGAVAWATTQSMSGLLG